MHRFLIDPDAIAGRLAPLGGDERAHATRVLRLRDGARVQAADGHGHIWEAELLLDGESASLRLLSELPDPEPPVRVTLYQGLPKADKLEWIAQKVTELGAARVVPVAMARSVVRLDARDGEKRRERLARIASEAAKQCGRAVVPEISPALRLEEAVEDMRGRDLLLTPWEEAEGLRLGGAFAARPDARDIGIVIGPEGGIERAEVERMRERAGALPVTLGPRILRAETAAIVCVALVMQLWGDM